jgi:carbohydrate-binding DOMON domain-containing protein
MGRESIQQTTPDKFSTDTVRDVSAESTEQSSGTVTAAATPLKRHVLPENLDHAVKQLTDDELMQLIEVALKEAKRRGKPSLQTEGSVQPSRPTEADQKRRSTEKTTSRKQITVAEVTLSTGKLNAVRAAFKAGVTPSRIARQFGISQANVRKALALESTKVLTRDR